MTDQATAETTTDTTPLRVGIKPATFTSRRSLVIRRFIRNRPAVVALVLLVVLFIGCYGLPPLLPYDYNALDYHGLLQPPSVKHWFGTNALGQDLLARTLRGMQKSMLIGFCVALISTSIAATVGSIAGYFGGWRDRALMWLVDLLLVVPGFLIIDATLNVGFAVLAETGLSFLGFGIQPPDVSLGTLIADGTPSTTTFPWVFLFPASALVLIVLCANLTGDGLRDALDPGSRPPRRKMRPRK